MDNRKLMHSGDIYSPEDPTILAEQTQAMLPMYEYNQTLPTEGKKRQALLKKMFAAVGKDCYIEPPFHANWGGHHIKLGNHVYANFNLTIADDTYVTIGDNTMIGPNVTMSSAAHPILPELRKHGYQYNLPIKIGSNCWLGAELSFFLELLLVIILLSVPEQLLLAIFRQMLLQWGFQLRSLAKSLNMIVNFITVIDESILNF